MEQLSESSPRPPYLTSALLPLPHGFFTRKGGVSQGCYAGLNAGPGSEDHPESVAQNRASIARSLGLAPEYMIGVQQCHSAGVVVIEDRALLSKAVQGVLPVAADALVTSQPGIGLVVLSADCQPVLLADPFAGVIGAAHAGWRGAFGGVLEATLAAMEGQGAQRANICAAIGPCISQKSYEVGQDFYERFNSQSPDNKQFFKIIDGFIYFDLPGYSLARLQAAGIAQAEWLGACTYSDEGQFFSYRRTIQSEGQSEGQSGKKDYGRLASVIRI